MFLVAPRHGSAQKLSPGTSVRITILLVPGLTAEDLTQPYTSIPALHKLMREGASGWMVCRAAKPADTDQLGPLGREPTDSQVFTLGCGGRARCGPEADGIVSPTPHNLHVLPYPPPGSIPALIKSNTGLGYSLTIGALGNMAHAAGMTTAAIGNMDSDRPDRSVYLMTMDSQGNVDDAGPRLSKNLSEDTAPFGIATNVPETLSAYYGVAEKDHLRVVAIGDLYRADRYGPVCLPGVAAAHRAMALQNVNTIIEQIAARIAAENYKSGSQRAIVSRLILLSPGPADSAPSAQDRIAPVVIWGSGVLPGSLSSLSTHRAGLIVNADILATVAEWLGQPLPQGATGRPIYSESTPGATDASPRLSREHYNLVLDADLQNSLGGLPTVQAVLVAMGVCAAMLKLGGKSTLRLASAVAAAIVSLPLGMLILPTLHPGSLVVGTSLLALFTLIAVVWVVGASSRAQGPYVVRLLCAILVVLVCADLVSGCHLMHEAWMSYSATDGSRFYGIGNEYMGAALGALIVLYPAFAGSPENQVELEVELESRAAHDKARVARAAYFTLFAITILIMAAPFAGAKAGAVPSAGTAFAFMLLMAWRGRIYLRDMFAVGIVLFVALAALAVLDSHGSQSHLIRSITGLGGDTMVTVLKRKLRMEARLITHSPWSVTLGVCVASLVLMQRNLSRFKTRSVRSDRVVFWGLSSGAAAALIFNDAGVLAAAMILLFGCAWMFASAAATMNSKGDRS